MGVRSIGIARIPHLRCLLGADRVVFRPPSWLHVDVMAGWGRKPNTAAVAQEAKRRGVPVLRLEDGFVRSVGLGREGAPPRSIVLDDLGVHHDAGRPSRLERILETGTFTEAERARARRAMQTIRREGLSKYNAAPDVDLGPRTRPRILIVDQSAGDLSLRLGRARTAEAMLWDTLEEHPGAELLWKVHPDVLAGHASSPVRAIERGAGRALPPGTSVRVLDRPCSPQSLLAQVDHVVTRTSLVGMEALVAGVPVTVHGAPFYAGWGLTDDRVECDRRTRRRSVEEVFAAAYLRYARYVDPESGQACSLEHTLAALSAWRRAAARSRGTTRALGFSVWKRSFLPAFLPGGRVVFSPRRSADRELVWGTKRAPSALPTLRVEDGFLRSVGLGSDLARPSSLALDARGLYYDPEAPSDLEWMLEHADFGEDELLRARALRRRIVEEGLSKYNPTAREGVRGATGRAVVLVVGQVEDDASIQRGCVDVRTNAELLAQARRARPDAHVIFKPHPDVVSGNRLGQVERPERFADEVVREASLADCLAAADEVHTMTSLVGFEALLRRLRVVVYGRPFYAGWGLTQDRHPFERRTRRRTLDELVAAALVRYPVYVSQRTGQVVAVETVVAQLLKARRRRPTGIGSHPATRWLRKGRNLAHALLMQRRRRA